MTTAVPERIAKRMARAGLCSRREAETWIEQGRVKVNGKKIVSPALNVSEADTVVVDGKALEAKEPSRLWLYHKPAGRVTTHKDPEGRPTVFEALPPELPRVISVGRLDLTTEGLLLLTNDGALARFMELPSTGWIRRYRARVYGVLTQEAIAQLARGVTVDGVRYGKVEVAVDSVKGHNSWVTVRLSEGKNREIRKVFEHVNCSVSRLIRTAYGPFSLGDLPKGNVREVPQRVWRNYMRAENPSG
jgi:23S rRNA pseudouridine2605 synthase